MDHNLSYQKLQHWFNKAIAIISNEIQTMQNLPSEKESNKNALESITLIEVHEDKWIERL